MSLSRAAYCNYCTIALLVLVLFGCTGATPTPLDTLTPIPNSNSPTTTVAIAADRKPLSTREPIRSPGLNLTLEFPTLTPTSTPFGMPPPVLPYPFYFLRRDEANGAAQLWRMERDTQTLSQITDEPAGIETHDYDVAADGQLVYVSNNRMVLANRDGGNPRVLLAGDPPVVDRFVPFDEVYAHTERISDVRWSPDGERIGYSQDGVNILDLASGERIKVTPPNGSPSRNDPTSIYRLYGWTPDGQYLIVQHAYIEGGDLCI